MSGGGRHRQRDHRVSGFACERPGAVNLGEALFDDRGPAETWECVLGDALPVVGDMNADDVTEMFACDFHLRRPTVQNGIQRAFDDGSSACSTRGVCHGKVDDR